MIYHWSSRYLTALFWMDYDKWSFGKNIFYSHVMETYFYTINSIFKKFPIQQKLLILLNLCQEKIHTETDRTGKGHEERKVIFQTITVANIQNPQTLTSETLSHRVTERWTQKYIRSKQREGKLSKEKEKRRKKAQMWGCICKELSPVYSGTLCLCLANPQTEICSLTHPLSSDNKWLLGQDLTKREKWKKNCVFDGYQISI